MSLSGSRYSTKDTFGSAMEDYFELKEPVLSPSTIRGYRAIEKNLRENFPAFLDTKMDAITEENIQRVVNALAATKSPKTVRSCYGFISAVCRSKKIHLDPCSLPPRVRPDVTVPASETVKIVLTAAKGTRMEILLHPCVLRPQKGRNLRPGAGGF